MPSENIIICIFTSLCLSLSKFLHQHQLVGWDTRFVLQTKDNPAVLIPTRKDTTWNKSKMLVTSNQGVHGMESSGHQCLRPLAVLMREDAEAKRPIGPRWTAFIGLSRTKLPSRITLMDLKQGRCDRPGRVQRLAAVGQSTWGVANDTFSQSRENSVKHLAGGSVKVSQERFIWTNVKEFMCHKSGRLSCEKRIVFNNKIKCRF